MGLDHVDVLCRAGGPSQAASPVCGGIPCTFDGGVLAGLHFGALTLRLTHRMLRQIKIIELIGHSRMTLVRTPGKDPFLLRTGTTFLAAKSRLLAVLRQIGSTQ